MMCTTKEFDPQKLIPNIHNEMFDLNQQKKELDLITQLDQLNMSSTKAHDPQLEATISAHGDGVPHADGGSRRVRRPQRDATRCRRCTAREARRADV